MAIDMTKEDYIDSNEAALLLKYKAPRQARTVLIAGGVKPIRIGYKKIMFLRKEVNRFLMERARERGRGL
jgi:hypothetical protein